MEKLFILEDDPRRMEKVYKKFGKFLVITHAEDVETAKRLFVKNEYYDYIFLDHDLGGEVFVDSINENTGYSFTKFMVKQQKNFRYGTIVLHSQNPVGAMNMKNALEDALFPRVFVIPFPQLIKDF